MKKVFLLIAIQLWQLNIVQANDYSVNGTTAPISYGETIIGGLNQGGEVNIYTFSGAQNDKIIIRMTDASVGNYMEPLIELLLHDFRLILK